MEPRRTPGIRSLGDSEDGEIPKIGRLRNLGNRGIGGNLFAWRKIRTSGNPVRFGRKGNSEASGDTGNFVARGLRRIEKNRYMWQKCETLSERAHGKPTNWGIGDFGSLEGSGDWEIRESVKSGGLEKIIICGKK